MMLPATGVIFSDAHGKAPQASVVVGMPHDEANIFDDDFLVRLEHVRLQMSKRFAGTLRAERRSRRMGSSLEFADFRNYVPGDDPRRIDWNIYGRIERLMMKLYEEEEELDVGVLIDCSASMHWRASDASHSSKFLLARQLAAALAYFALHGLDHVALWFFDSTLRAESGHYRGIPAFHDVLRFLRADPSGRETDLSSSLERFGRGRRRRGLAIVLSDCLDPSGYERGLSALVGRHFAVHLVHLDGSWRMRSQPKRRFAPPRLRERAGTGGNGQPDPAAALSRGSRSLSRWTQVLVRPTQCRLLLCQRRRRF